MARIRSLKPEFWTDEELAAGACRDARMLYMGMWNLADEHGRLRGDPRFIKGQVFAYDDDLTPDVVDKLLDELDALGKVVRYRVSGARYAFLPKLAEHQRLEADKVPSRLPAPEDADHEPPPDQPEPPRANKSAPDSDESARGAEDHALLYGSGVRGHGSGNNNVSDAATTPEAVEPEPEAPPRLDVEQICRHLADRIEANGAKRPLITAKWRTAARRMIDADGRTVEQILGAIDWCQNDDFWRANILSMPKLREKYDQLSLQARRRPGQAVVPAGPYRGTRDIKLDQVDIAFADFEAQLQSGGAP